ncbi:hypothetical protein niasHT_039948 [Heterodera trifolii]|uniref:Uncharacterized protein n=1 Tax=Heterodera trifolii TaxID=157864 RepID=A0ABD2I7S1_9BILA
MPKAHFMRYVLITGATDGIGKQLAYELASNVEENFVIVHGRSRQKCEETIGWLLSGQHRIGHNSLPTAAAGNSHSNVDFVTADFSKLAEVAQMCEEIRLRFPKLNGIVSCASVLPSRRTKSHDGLELTIQVNHLAHVLLWTDLLPLLEHNSPSRLLTVGSMLHNFCSIDWNDLMCERSVYDKFRQYSRSMLMNHLATLYIHRLLFKHKKQFQVTCNVVDAEQHIEKRMELCVVKNNDTATLNHHLSTSDSCLYQHTNAIDTLVRLAERKEFNGISGKYYDANGKEIKLGADTSDVRVQDKLWIESSLICNAILGRKTATESTIENSFKYATIFQ